MQTSFSGAASLAAFVILVAACGHGQPRDPASTTTSVDEQNAAREDASADLTDIPEPRGHGHSGSVPVEEAGHDLLLFGSDGIRAVSARGERQLWGRAVTNVRADLRGGVVLEEVDATGSAVAVHLVRWLPRDADAPRLPLGARDHDARLHAVVPIDGHPTALVTRRTGEGDNEEEMLVAHTLATGAERPLGVTGRHESGLGGVGLFGDELVLSRCHLQCRLVTVPFGSDLEGDEVADLLPGPVAIEGVTVAGEHVAYVERPHPGDAEGPEPTLWRYDLVTGERDGYPLPATGVADPFVVSVDLTADGQVALVEFRHVDDLHSAQTLLVDGLATTPRSRWLETSERVRLDVRT